MLGGQSYPNNSIFLMTDIGADGSALLCVTDNVNCCDQVPNRMGEWFYPNKAPVPNLANGENFYRNRGSQVVRLNSCLLYTSPSPRDATLSRMPSSA